MGRRTVLVTLLSGRRCLILVKNLKFEPKMQKSNQISKKKNSDFAPRRVEIKLSNPSMQYAKHPQQSTANCQKALAEFGGPGRHHLLPFVSLGVARLTAALSFYILRRQIGYLNFQFRSLELLLYIFGYLFGSLIFQFRYLEWPL